VQAQVVTDPRHYQLHSTILYCATGRLPRTSTTNLHHALTCLSTGASTWVCNHFSGAKDAALR
jgi:hypothetical protein